MNTAEFVAKQIVKPFTMRKIPDLRHTQYCRRHTCMDLSLGFKASRAAGSFYAFMFYESFHSFRDNPSRYYTNDVITWKDIVDHG